MTHYHIRWSGKVLLDWQCFSTPEEAKASARQLVRQGRPTLLSHTTKRVRDAKPR
jgi:hypothetical protein